jgi:HEAT repeat protein
VALGIYGPKAYEAVPHLIEILETPEEEALVRISAVQALGKIGESSETAISPLIDLLGDEDKQMRREAAFSLYLIGSESIDQLVEELQNNDTDIQVEAAWALGKYGAESAVAVPDLQELLQSPEPKVQRQAIDSLGEIGEPSEPAIP